MANFNVSLLGLLVESLFGCLRSFSATLNHLFSNSSGNIQLIISYSFGLLIIVREYLDVICVLFLYFLKLQSVFWSNCGI